MVRVVDCHAGVLGSNPGRPKRFSPWNYFTVGSGKSVAPESASGSGSRLFFVSSWSVNLIRVFSMIIHCIS